MKRRTLILGALMLLCAILLAGCGGPAIKTEDEILTDIQDGGYMNQMAVSNDPIETISSMEILKRQTNREDKTDIVYVTAQADTEKVHFVRSMKLIYNLYDDKGWVLDSCENYPEGESSTVPLKGPDESTLDAFFDLFSTVHGEETLFRDYISWSLDSADTDLSSGTSTLKVTASRETKFIRTHESLTMKAHFNSDLSFWEVDGSSVSPYLTRMSCEMKGSEWTVHENIRAYDNTTYPNYYQLTVYDLDTENLTVTLSLVKVDTKNGTFETKYSGTYPFQWCKDTQDTPIDLENLQDSEIDLSLLNTLNFFKIITKVGGWNAFISPGGIALVGPYYMQYTN